MSELFYCPLIFLMNPLKFMYQMEKDKLTLVEKTSFAAVLAPSNSDSSK